MIKSFSTHPTMQNILQFFLQSIPWYDPVVDTCTICPILPNIDKESDGHLAEMRGFHGLDVQKDPEENVKADKIECFSSLYCFNVDWKKVQQGIFDGQEKSLLVTRFIFYTFWSPIDTVAHPFGTKLSVFISKALAGYSKSFYLTSIMCDKNVE